MGYSPPGLKELDMTEELSTYDLFLTCALYIYRVLVVKVKSDMVKKNIA